MSASVARASGGSSDRLTVLRPLVPALVCVLLRAVDVALAVALTAVLVLVSAVPAEGLSLPPLPAT